MTDWRSELAMSGTTENQMRAYAETGAKTLYPASPIKRHRATAAEMEERAQPRRRTCPRDEPEAA